MKTKIIKGLQATGEASEGEILFLGKEEIDLEKLKENLTGKILVGGTFTRAALAKAQAMEVAGIVTVNISEELFEKVSRGKNWEIGESFCLKLPLLVIEESILAELATFTGERGVLEPKEKQIEVGNKE